MMQTQNSTSLATKTHPRTPVALLLPNDLKRLVHYIRTALERQHSQAATIVDDQSASSGQIESPPPLNAASEN